MYERWRYFLSIEKDFLRTVDFVHLDDANDLTFSNEYAKLLLLIGSEVDVVAKLVCAVAQPAARPKNIVDYHAIITAAFVGMPDIEIDLPRFGKTVKPWDSWRRPPPNSPLWWTAYNNVKHEREANFNQANQQNTVAALCGLLALLLYHYKNEAHLQPYPELLNYGFPSYLVTDGGKKLPGA